MALKATVFKADLQISDMDRGYYHNHTLTVARHPSETDERMMVRVLAFAMYASEALAFGKGMSTEDEPTLWEKDLTGVIQRWIDVGQPDEREVRKAAGRARHVVIINYGRSSDTWWNLNRDKLQRLNNLTVLKLPTEATLALAALAKRTMEFQVSIQDKLVWITCENENVQIEPAILFPLDVGSH